MADARIRALRLYRQSLRLAKQWKGPQQERVYIAQEAALLFRRNRFVSDAETIESKLFEAESRIALAEHYGIPYPRPYHVARGSVPKHGFSLVESQYNHTSDDFWRNDTPPRRHDPAEFAFCNAPADPYAHAA
eukprot:TRINITY_DN4181_c0_g1_i1.p4 TRINITY_DN4181_c0_g1~~TRINITY_DN4181_c0_g1_i1.p4  ORF type:complete len:133 (+),score=7.40 TRINITY_DN4181_c0_g1_i1:203-601(+)